MDQPDRDGAMRRTARRTARSIRAHPWITSAVAVVTVAGLVAASVIGMDLVIALTLVVVVGAGAIVAGRVWRRLRPVAGPASGGVVVACLVVSTVVTFGMIQLVPYGRSHSNPPVTGEPRWASARTRQLVVDACFACHSNEVDYPAYASIAPISWTVQRHVDEGREKVNFSEWPGAEEADESAELVEEGEMPPPYFTRFGLHPEANLTDAERAELLDGLRRTPGLADE